MRHLLASSLLLVLVGTSCRAPFRYPAEERPSVQATERILVEDLNPFILTNLVSDRLIVEVDGVGQAQPKPEALEGLRRTLAKHCPEDKRIEIVVDDTIPLEDWNAEPGDFRQKNALLARYLDHDPEDWDEAELIYVVYVPGDQEFLGWITELDLDRRGTSVRAPVIFIFPDRIRRQAQLWITPRRVERAILVHEVGHLLGLVADPGHQERGNAYHCTEPQCVMTHQRGRAQLYNALPAMFAGRIPDDYCRKCRGDIRLAQRLWAERAASDPAFLDTLRTRRATEDRRSRWRARLATER